MGNTIRTREGPILAQMRRFSAAYVKELTVAGTRWRYYRLGSGPAVVWLTGGLRRAALGFAFLELMASRYTVLAPDYPPLRTIEEFDRGLSAILRAEGIGRFHLVCQSYGGMLGQCYLARHPEEVDRLVLSSTGPADYRRLWLPVSYLITALLRVLPERRVKAMLAGRLGSVLGTAEEHEGWLAALRDTLDHDLTRADAISHFAVAADVIRSRAVHPGAFQAWQGQAVALSAENDPTQDSKDKARYEKLLGRPVDVISMGQAGHIACLLAPHQYVKWLEQALAYGLPEVSTDGQREDDRGYRTGEA
jgi:pimeloyl-ACP methyl ester carboxylesterase